MESFFISGIKCDHCNWKDELVEFSQYTEFINKPCPECGNNLLTKEDYTLAVRITQRAAKIMKLYNVVKWFFPIHYWRLLTGKKEKSQHITMGFPHIKQEHHGK